MELTEQNISEMLENVPTFSQSAIRVLELTGDINSSTKELVRQITYDPILTANVLKLVNSAYFGLSREIQSIQQSVVYVGMNTIKNLAISVAAIGALPKTNDAGLDMSCFWLHSLVTASIAKLIAEKRSIPAQERSGYFISGLLHDIGMIILSNAQPESYREVLAEASKQEKSLKELEELEFGISHAEIGGILAEKWNLPPEMVAAIRHHHDPEGQEAESLKSTIFVADQIAKTLDEEDSRISRVEAIPVEIEQWLGESLAEVIASLETLDEEIDKARVFIKF